VVVRREGVQFEFVARGGVGRVGSGIFAVGGVLELAAAWILEAPGYRHSADIVFASGAGLRRRSLQPTGLK